MINKIKYPRLSRARDNRVKISEATKIEIIRLRKLDPIEWTYQKLAKLYQISRSSATRICDPEQKARANATTKRIIMEKWRNDPEFRQRETDRVKEYIKKREKNSKAFRQYQNQYDRKRKVVRKSRQLMLYVKNK